MKKLFPGFFVFVALLSLEACAPNQDGRSDTSEAWNQENHPGNLGISSAVRFDLIPRAGQLSGVSIPWSGDYWPTYQGGISNRWSQGDLGTNFRSYHYQVLTPQQIATLSESQLNLLSPAEKYDLYTGRFDFPLTREELNRMLSTVEPRSVSIPTWFGLCHGWASASYLEPEPGPGASVQLADGRRMTFFKSDLKALITKLYADAEVPARMIGTRCENENSHTFFRGRWFQNPSCRDTNAGSFHLTVTEYIGRANHSFIAEMDRGAEVWNHPVFGYRFEYSNLQNIRPWEARRQQMAPGTVQTVHVSMVLTYVVESDAGDERTPLLKDRRLEYRLELNPYGQIIGGAWANGINQPDFLWQLTARPSGTVGNLSSDLVRQLIHFSRQ